MIAKSGFFPVVPKNDRLVQELQDRRLHPKLLLMMFDLGYWLWSKHGVRLVVTHLYRTPEEQKQFYPEDWRGKISVHQEWRGADVVPENRDESLYPAMEAYIYGRYAYEGTPGFTSSDAHEVGENKKHLHIQVGHKEANKTQHKFEDRG